jgi:translation initiation factor 4G
MPGLDDDSIDFPQAYRAVAILMRSISLPEADIDALLKKVDVYGEPRITPKMKLDKALAVLDEEIGDD